MNFDKMICLLIFAIANSVKTNLPNAHSELEITNITKETILKEAFKMANSEQIIVEKLLNKIASGILCNKKYKIEIQKSDDELAEIGTKFQKIQDQFCSNLGADFDVWQAIVMLENIAKNLTLALLQMPKIQARIRIAKIRNAMGNNFGKNELILDQIFLEFEQLFGIFGNFGTMTMPPTNQTAQAMQHAEILQRLQQKVARRKRRGIGRKAGVILRQAIAGHRVMTKISMAPGHLAQFTTSKTALHTTPRDGAVPTKENDAGKNAGNDAELPENAEKNNAVNAAASEHHPHQALTSNNIKTLPNPDPREGNKNTSIHRGNMAWANLSIRRANTAMQSSNSGVSTAETAEMQAHVTKAAAALAKRAAELAKTASADAANTAAELADISAVFSDSAAVLAKRSKQLEHEEKKNKKKTMGWQKAYNIASFFVLLANFGVMLALAVIICGN